jgi:hypothetical protein
MATLACCVSLLVGLLAFMVGSSMATRRALSWLRVKLNRLQEFVSSSLVRMTRRLAMSRNAGQRSAD